MRATVAAAVAIVAGMAAPASVGVDPLLALRPSVRAYTERDGLPQGTIHAIAFDMPDRTVSNFVRAVLPASDGRIWAATHGGGVAELHLAPKERDVAFEFALLAFHGESLVRYRSQLAGWEEAPSEWETPALGEADSGVGKGPRGEHPEPGVGHAPRGLQEDRRHLARGVEVEVPDEGFGQRLNVPVEQGEGAEAREENEEALEAFQGRDGLQARAGAGGRVGHGASDSGSPCSSSNSRWKRWRNRWNAGAKTTPAATRKTMPLKRA